MNKRFFRNSTIGWAAICMMSMSLLAQTEPPKDQTDVRKSVRIMVRYLDMPPDQVARFIELRQHLRESLGPKHEVLKRLKAGLKEALSQDPPLSALVGDLVIEIHTVTQEIRRYHAAYQQAFGEMLDDEQLAEMERLQATARLRSVIHAFSALGLLNTPTDTPEPGVVDDGERAPTRRGIRSSLPGPRTRPSGP